MHSEQAVGLKRNIKSSRYRRRYNFVDWNLMGFPLLLIQNAKSFEEKENYSNSTSQVRETYFNDIQVRFEQQSPEAQKCFRSSIDNRECI